MSLWQSPYRPPPIRSKSVVRVHRSAADGDVPGQAPQPFDPPDMIPLKRGYWAAYGKQTLACGFGLALSVFFLWGASLYSDAEHHQGFEQWKGVVLIINLDPDPNKYWDSGYGWRNAMEAANWELTVYTHTPPQPDGEPSTVYMWLAGLIAGVMLLIPLFFVSRWRRMEKIFGEEMYDSDEGVADDDGGDGDGGDADAKGAGHHLSAEELLRRHPNPGQLLDGTQVAGAAVLLVTTAMVQLVVGVMLLFVMTPEYALASPTLWKIFGGGLFLQALVNLVLLVATLRHVVAAPRLAFQLSLIGLCVSLLTVHWLPIAACAATAGMLWRMHGAFQMMLARVAEPEKQDPLVAYYHNLLQLLVWVMRADDHCDRRELHKIKHTCDAVNLSSWERDVVIASANLDSRKDLSKAAKRYLESARAAEIADAGQSLIVVATAVAGADGVIVREEADAVRQLAKLVGVPRDNADQLLLQQQLHLEALDTARAHTLLHLDRGATPDQIQAAHRALAEELEETHFQHIGTTLADQLHQRQAILDRARDLLLKDTTA